MNKIAPPRPKSGRTQRTWQVTAYQDTVVKLDALVKRKNTSRVEYLRWLVDCAEAGLVGDFLASTLDDKGEMLNTLLEGLADGALTLQEAKVSGGVILGVTRTAAKLEALDTWTKEQS